MRVIQDREEFKIYGDFIQVSKALPLQVYSVSYNQNEGFSLEKRCDRMKIYEPKIYGIHEEKIKKTMKSYKRKNKSMGVILSGKKGIGKSLFSALLINDAIDNGLPVIMVDGYIPGIANFLESIDQEVMIMFDEFEKTFVKGNSDSGADAQSTLLGLLDGTSVNKKLFVVTCNGITGLNDFMVNRPGRFHYHFRFENPTPAEITEYMKDKLDAPGLSAEFIEKEINAVVSFSGKAEINYDCLRAIVFELNEGITFKEAIKDLNIMKMKNENYNVTLHAKNGETFTGSCSLDLFDPEFTGCVYFDDHDGYSAFIGNIRSRDAIYSEELFGYFIPEEKLQIRPVSDLDEDDEEKYKNMKFSRITIARREQPSYHYNF